MSLHISLFQFPSGKLVLITELSKPNKQVRQQSNINMYKINKPYKNCPEVGWLKINVILPVSRKRHAQRHLTLYSALQKTQSFVPQEIGLNPWNSLIEDSWPAIHKNLTHYHYFLVSDIPSAPASPTDEEEL